MPAAHSKRIGGNRKPQTFKTCEQCGHRFGPVDRLNKRFCSRACRAAWFTGRPSPKAGVKYPHLQRVFPQPCLHCRKPFKPRGDWGDRRQVYCSRHCYVKHRRVSQFERRVMDGLAALGLAIDRSVRIGRWTFDGQISGTLVLIEADGAYWHSLPVAVARDARKDAWCQAHGYTLLRVPELEFYADPKATLAKVALATV